MAEKTINVTGKVLPSDQRKFGRINDDQNNEYVVFETELLQYFEVGKPAIVETREQQKKGKEGTYLVIENVKVNGEWKAKPKEKKDWKGGWDNSPLKTRSMCLSYAKDLVVAEKLGLDQILPKAQEFYDWVMKAAPEKPAQETKAPTAVPAATPAATPAAEGDPQTIKELLERVAAHGKEFTRTWIVNKCKIPENRLKEDPAGCWREIKQLQGW